MTEALPGDFPSDVEFREVRGDDFDEVRAFLLTHEYAFRDSEPEQYIERSSSRMDAEARKFMSKLAAGKQRYFCLGAFREATLIGSIFLEVYDIQGRDACHVHGLWIEAESRRLGIARHLKLRAEAWGKAQGCAFMDANVRVGNARMIALNEDLGYSVARLNFRKPLT